MVGAKDVVMGFQSAMGKNDWAGARKQFADRLDFTGPFDRFSTPEEYLSSLQKLHPIVERVDLKKMFVDGDDVCLLYDLVTRTPAGTAFVAEWYHVVDGKIDRVHVVFDARPFAAMMGR
jgi:hypothetical protein